MEDDVSLRRSERERDEDMKDIKALMMHAPHLVNGTVIKSNYL